MNQYINHSGGCEGSDMEWEIIGYEYGVSTNAYSFRGHKQYGKNPIILNTDQLLEGWNQALVAERTLKRNLKNIEYNPYPRNLISRNWFQVKHSDAVFAIGKFHKYTLPLKLVAGGTGWAVQMAIDNHVDVYFYDQNGGKWYIYYMLRDKFIPYNNIPTLTHNFAGIGTRDINDYGKNAIREVYENTFKNG